MCSGENCYLSLGQTMQCSFRRIDGSVEEKYNYYKVVGDGHCLFRSLSLAVWNTEEKHAVMRKLIVDFVVQHWDQLLDMKIAVYDTLYPTAQSYKSGMGDLNKREYGTDFEARIFCHLFGKYVAVFLGLVDSNFERNIINLSQHTKPQVHNTVFLQFVGKADNITEMQVGHYDLLVPILDESSPIDFTYSQVTKYRRFDMTFVKSCSKKLYSDVVKFNCASMKQSESNDSTSGIFISKTCVIENEQKTATQQTKLLLCEDIYSSQSTFNNDKQTTMPSLNDSSNITKEIVSQTNQIQRQIGPEVLTLGDIERTIILEHQAKLCDWKIALNCDPKLVELKKEILHHYRQGNGRCIFKESYIEEETSSELKLKKVELQQCLFNECNNRVVAEFEIKDGCNVKIKITELLQAADIDRLGHEMDQPDLESDYFMNDILLYARNWDMVFTGKKSPEDKRKSCNKKLLDNVYLHFEGTIIAPKVAVEENGVFNKELCRNVIKKKLLSDLNVSCVVVFYKTIQRKNKYVMYCKCGHSKKNSSPCKRFKLDICIDSENINIDVYADSLQIIHKEHKGYMLKGIEREEVKKTLKQTSCKAFQLKSLKAIDKQAFQVGLNKQQLQTLTVLRQCKSEVIKEDDIHSDDLLDLIYRWISEKSKEEDERYVQNVALPLAVHLYSKEQIQLAQKLINKGTGYFDATGSVCRNVYPNQNKRILYYALVMNFEKQIIPIFEMISENHDAMTLANLFNSIKHYSLKLNRNKWPLIHRVVCDWSWAMFIAIVHSWNTMTILDYLKICYKYSTTRENALEFQNIVTVHSCCSHFMKMISDRLNKFQIKNKVLRRFILVVLGNMLMETNLSSIDNLFVSLLTVLLCEEQCPLVEQNINALQEIVEGVADNDVIYTEPTLEISDENNDGIYRPDKNMTKVDSPFNVRYTNLMEVVQLGIQMAKEEIENAKDNMLYCPQMANYISTFLMPLLPIWSGLMFPVHNEDVDSKRMSNANVENYFGQIKSRVLEGKLHLKIGRFINKLEENLKSNLLSINLEVSKINYKKKSQNRQPLKRQLCAVDLNDNEEDIDDPTLEEGWSKRMKKDTTYFNQSELFLKRIESRPQGFPYNSQYILGGMNIVGNTQKYVANNFEKVTHDHNYCKYVDKCCADIAIGKLDIADVFNTGIKKYDKSNPNNSESRPSHNVTVNSWLAVERKRQLWFPGLVTRIEGNIFYLKFMHRLSNLFYWPSVEDCQTLHMDDVLCTLKEPTKVSSVHFKFNGCEIADELCKT